MARTAKYSDLKEFGLEFATPQAVEFSDVVQAFEEYPAVLAVASDTPTAVLLNNSGKTILALGYALKYTYRDGRVNTIRRPGLFSRKLIEVFTGRAEIPRNQFDFILPGSKRFISEGGIAGDNSDVLPAESRIQEKLSLPFDDCLFMFRSEQIATVELALDLIFFEDGLCVGPDEANLFQIVTGDIAEQITVAREIVEMLERGESVERVSAVLKPLTLKGWDKGGHPTRLLSWYATDALERISAGGSDLLAWFRRSAQPPRVHLHRPQP
jgi:hypothetical protein